MRSQISKVDKMLKDLSQIYEVNSQWLHSNLMVDMATQIKALMVLLCYCWRESFSWKGNLLDVNILMALFVLLLKRVQTNQCSLISPFHNNVTTEMQCCDVRHFSWTHDSSPGHLWRDWKTKERESLVRREKSERRKLSPKRTRQTGFSSGPVSLESLESLYILIVASYEKIRITFLVQSRSPLHRV